MHDLPQDIRAEYGIHLRWLLPFPGDWHLLCNYHIALMKAHADAEFRELGGVSGHRAEAVTSLTNFRTTHNLLLQTYEGLASILSLHLHHPPFSF